MTPVLKVKDIHKTYRMGEVLVPALKGVSFEVEEGGFLAIFGPSEAENPLYSMWWVDWTGRIRGRYSLMPSTSSR